METPEKHNGEDAKNDAEEQGHEKRTPKTASFKAQLSIQDFMHRRTNRSSPRSSSNPSSAPSRTLIKKSRPPPKRSGGYASPSAYAHLPLLRDAILPEPIILFVGLNPGVQTAATGHAYAHPSNLFWRLLHSSGITPRLCRPEEDRIMPAEFGLGFTNIVERPTRNGTELADHELDAGVQVLERKAREFRPESICIVGKSIWESIWRVRHGKPVGKNFKYGWQDATENMGRQRVPEGNWKGASVFVATTTSGLAVSMRMEEKERIWAELGEWAKKRRAEKEIEEAEEGRAEEETLRKVDLPS